MQIKLIMTADQTEKMHVFSYHKTLSLVRKRIGVYQIGRLLRTLFACLIFLFLIFLIFDFSIFLTFGERFGGNLSRIFEGILTEFSFVRPSVRRDWQKCWRKLWRNLWRNFLSSVRPSPEFGGSFGGISVGTCL